MGPVLIGVLCEFRVRHHDVFTVRRFDDRVAHINRFDKTFLAIGQNHEIPYSDRPIKEDNQAGNKVCRNRLKAKTNTQGNGREDNN